MHVLAAAFALLGLLPLCSADAADALSADAAPCDRLAACRKRFWSSGGMFLRAVRTACDCGQELTPEEEKRLLRVGVGSWALGLASGVLLDAALRRGGPEAQLPEAVDAEELVVPEVGPGSIRPSQAAPTTLLETLYPSARAALLRWRSSLEQLAEPFRRGARTWIPGIADLSFRIDHVWWQMVAFAFAIYVGVWVRRKWGITGLLRRKEQQGGKGKVVIPKHGVPVFGKGKGKSPPPPGKGGAGPPSGAPPKGKGPGGKGKAPAAKSSTSPRGKDGACASDQDPNSCETPFGRRIHWVQPSYNEPVGDTIFGKLGSSDGPQFDQKLLTAIFAGDAAKNKKKSFTVPKNTGKCLLDTQRAQGAAIMLNRLKVTTLELCRCVNDLDIADARLTVDDLEMVALAMPTPEESAKLLQCKEEIEQLRDIEQKLIPLCYLNPGRLRLSKFALSHSMSYTSTLSRVRLIKAAAEEAQRSTQFMEFLRLSLQVGNFINHGEAEMRDGMVRAFALESLQMLSSCKAGPVSALHFVCLTLKSEDPGFMTSLTLSLSHLREAAREKVAVLEGEIANFSNEVQFVKSRLEQLGPEDNSREHMEKLLTEVEQEGANLKTEMSKALQAVSDVQTYYHVSVKKGAAPPTSEQFFGQIVANLDNLQTAWREVEANGRRWQRQFQKPTKISTETQDDAPPKEVTEDSTWAAATDPPAGSEAQPAEPPQGDEEEASKQPQSRRSCPASVMRQGKQRKEKRGPEGPPYSARGPAVGCPLVTPRKAPQIVEFHAMHDGDESDKDSTGSPSSFSRSRTSFPDIWEFEPCPREETDSTERTWDFAISGTSAYAVTLLRRQRQSGVINRDHIPRQNTC